MKRIIAAALGAVLALAYGLVSAQAYQNEVSVFGTIESADEPEDYDLSIVNLRYGRYLSPQAVATLGVGRSHFDAFGADSTTTAITVGAKYYFGQVQQARAWVPFGEAALGFANVDTGRDDSWDLTWEFGGGVSYFLSEATSFDASVRWYHTDTEVESEGVRMFFGLSTRF